MDQRTTEALRQRLSGEQGELLRQLQDLGARQDAEVDPVLGDELLDHPVRVAGAEAVLLVDRVVHAAGAVVVHEDVRGIAVLMATVARTPALSNSPHVVLRRAEAGHHRQVPNGNALARELGDHQLELVDEAGVEDEVLGPDALLVVRQEVAQPEVLRDVRVLVLRRHLDEPARVAVVRQARGAALRPA